MRGHRCDAPLGDRLSGRSAPFTTVRGQRQRVNVAQGLALDHHVMLMTKPSRSGHRLRTNVSIGHPRIGQRGENSSPTSTPGRGTRRRTLHPGQRTAVSSGPPESVCNRHNVEGGIRLGGLQAGKASWTDPAHDPHLRARAPRVTSGQIRERHSRASGRDATESPASACPAGYSRVSPSVTVPALVTPSNKAIPTARGWRCWPS